MSPAVVTLLWIGGAFVAAVLVLGVAAAAGRTERQPKPPSLGPAPVGVIPHQRSAVCVGTLHRSPSAAVRGRVDDDTVEVLWYCSACGGSAKSVLTRTELADSWTPFGVLRWPA